MSGLISTQVGRLNWRLLLVNGILLSGLTAAALASKDYLSNVLRGPFPVPQTQLAEAMDHPNPAREYLKVDFDKTIKTGLYYEVTDHNVTTRYPYSAAWVNHRLLVIEEPAVRRSAALSGRLRGPTPQESQRVLRRIESLGPELTGKVAPYIFDAHDDYATLGYVLGVAGILLGALALWNVLQAVRRIGNPQLHPVYRRLARLGDPAALAAQIDAEAAGQVQQVGRCRFTTHWLLRSSTFGLVPMRMDDLVWVHKKVVRHYHSGIPTGKTFAAAVHDRNGTRVEISGREAKVDQMLEIMVRRAPWVFVGFSKETQKAWKAGRAALIAACDQRRQALVAAPA